VIELLFVTVGTTAIGNPNIGDSILTGLSSTYLKKPGREKKAYAEQQDLKSKLVAAHVAFWKGFEGRYPSVDDFDGTSAELTSTMALVQHHPSINRIVLLSSDTPEGELATEINDGVLPQIWKRGEVVEKTVPRLESGFTTITPELEKILVEYAAGSAECVHFNVTGGFKGVIPSITYLAMQHPGWRIHYQYQGSYTASEVFFSKGQSETKAKDGSVQGVVMNEVKKVYRPKVYPPDRVRG